MSNQPNLYKKVANQFPDFIKEYENLKTEIKNPKEQMKKKL